MYIFFNKKWPYILDVMIFILIKKCGPHIFQIFQAKTKYKENTLVGRENFDDFIIAKKRFSLSYYEFEWNFFTKYILKHGGNRAKWPQSRCTATNIFLVVSTIWCSYTDELYFKMIGYSWKIDGNHHHQHFLFKI